jgi:hypothetical protein
MGPLRRRVPVHFIPIHPANVAGKDWVIVLEAGTVVGPSPRRLRVARATQERTVVKRYNVLLRPSHYLVIDGYNPRFQAVYFCPQLYRYESDRKLVPLQGEEIGDLIAQSVEGAVAERRPWYEPPERLPDARLIAAPVGIAYDTVVVEMSSGRNSAAG